MQCNAKLDGFSLPPSHQHAARAQSLRAHKHITPLQRISTGTADQPRHRGRSARPSGRALMMDERRSRPYTMSASAFTSQYRLHSGILFLRRYCNPSYRSPSWLESVHWPRDGQDEGRRSGGAGPRRRSPSNPCPNCSTRGATKTAL